MPQSLSRVFVHIVFSTKRRFPFLLNRSIREEMHAYLAGAFKGLDCPVVTVGGVADHVHILCLLSRKHPISHIIKEAKGQSSKWVKMKGASMRKFEWQRGYGIFSVTPDAVEIVRQYVASQEEHHRRKPFVDEYREILRKNGVEFNEGFVWD